MFSLDVWKIPHSVEFFIEKLFLAFLVHKALNLAIVDK